MVTNNDANNVDFYNFLLFAISLGLGLLSLMVFNSPPTPPSASAQKGTLNFKEGWKQMAANKSFWILAGVFTAVYASFTTVATFLSNYVTPYGFSETDSGNIGIAYVLGGIVACIVVGVICDKFKMHQLALRILSVIFLIGVVGFYFGCVRSNGWLLYVSSVVIGAGGLPVLSLAFELGAECTYPVAEATSTGILMTGGMIFSVIMLVVTNALAEAGTNKLWKGLLFVIATAVVAMLGSFSYRTENRRMVLERGGCVEGVELEEVKRNE
ncbi:hypothetical protein HDU98_007815 [Podochytrium sp. JEL0797]|nr:hypothetical protein HDU98_007815 [Podochytrium sp. JEL0797]